MSNTTSRSKAAALAQLQALVTGMQLHFPNGSFTIGSVAFTTASLAQEFQSLADAMQKVNAADAGAKDLRGALQSTAAKVDPVVRAFQRIVVSAFANATQTLADFGMQAPKARRPLTIEVRATATAKMRATRKARGTTSKKQKLAIKGDVMGVVVTPITEPARASPTQPAPSPSEALATPPK